VAPTHNKKVQIINPVVEQILINPVWAKRSFGDQVQVGSEFVRSNQVVILFGGYREEGVRGR